VAKPFPFRIEFPPELPISARAEEIVAAIQANPVVILAGETGSGKTTQIPKMCLVAGRGTKGRIACTQPRRVAALSISRRVADELAVNWGREVGCKIRFNDQTSNATVVKFLTDGMLLAEVQSDPLLREYDTLIIDEAHERSLNIDFLLGHLRLLRYKRPELKIIITSATIDTEAFSKAFDDAPIIQVSGRMFPVEVIYAPLDEFGSDASSDDDLTAKAEALHYVDGAVEAVERIVRESPSGDVLVFMPSERDIRETCDLLEGKRPRGCELVPLFGRLSNSDQQRVFAQTQSRKIVVATNIAETSLTIPGIRFVVDTGLARVSRYAQQSRTRRLPIEEIAQSSADQRKGRSGRVAEGVCIRLYSEKDFNERPRFAQPEIQRANLADVILRMKAFGLGDIERFPFINMPASKAIRAGYALLDELGAIERLVETGPADAQPSTKEAVAAYSFSLTPLGRELARLPVDPTVARMILQGRTEKCLREILVIAAGLSIQDPRERPADAREKADAAHRRFSHPDSDFLALLNIWDAFHDQFETMSQSRLRRFCREHFLSYTRMREWRDIHSQLLDVLEEREGFKLTSAFHGLKPEELTPEKEAFGTPVYRAIHRSILAGLLGNIATRDDENGGYRATHDRRVAIFPGSVLFSREEPRRRPDGRQKPENKGGKTPRWIMAAEIMETSRLYARGVARLDPLWALELATHLVKISHSEPFWNVEGGRVMVKQKTRLYGLELESRAVGFGKIDPQAATEIFIREALVNDTLTWPFDFLRHNREVRAKVESLLTRARDSSYMNLDEAIYRFYAQHLLDSSDQTVRERVEGKGVSSVGDLVDLVKEMKAADPDFLEMEPEDLRDPDALATDDIAYPESVPLDNRALPVTYAYKPGQADDGVTLDVGVREASRLTSAAIDWAIPGHLEAKVEHYLRATPKELRRAFVPLAETAKAVAAQLEQRDRLTGRRETLLEALGAQLAERFGVRVDPALWEGKPLPEHLRVRIRVIDDDGSEICASRELPEIMAALGERHREVSAKVAEEDPQAWRKARSRWEKADSASWTFGSIPARVTVSEQAGVKVYAYPGLKTGRDGVSLRLFRDTAEADSSSIDAFGRLLQLQLRYELGWLEKDLRAMRELGTLTATLAPVETLMRQMHASIQLWICDGGRVGYFSRERSEPGERDKNESGVFVSETAFASALDRAKDDLRGLVPKLMDLLREILSARQTLLVHPTPYKDLAGDLSALVGPNFLATTPYLQLAHFPRYLKAMRLRCERWKQNPAKDAERAAILAPYTRMARETGQNSDRVRWLVEEFRVSLFAQELGTAEAVSTVKLDRVIAEQKSVAGRPTETAKPLLEAAEKKLPKVEATTAATPILTAPVTTKRSGPLKSFGSLDALLKRR
jgi:ATP-dependent helicase HrpA